MTTYFCKSCNYKFTPRGKREPRICPCCGRSSIVKSYTAQMILEEVTKEPGFQF